MDRTVTRLTAQKRNPNRINVFLDDEFAFSLDRLAAAWLEIGQTISPSRIQELIQNDALENSHRKVMNLLSIRPRTAHEIQQYLIKTGLPPTTREIILGRLKETGLLSDTKFALAWTENRQTMHPRSQRMIAMEMRNKGIAREDIEFALAQSDDDSNLARNLVEQLKHKFNGLDRQTFRRKMTGILARKGFDSEIIQQTVQQTWQDWNGERTTLETKEDVEWKTTS